MPKPPPTDAAELIPDRPSVETVRAAAKNCQACDLWRRGTQTVFGEGGSTAELMFVGEQPGDAEDLEGRPFVGPAGKLLDRILQEVGIDRSRVYVTNVVKHFKWEPRGKRRIHKKPSASEIVACRPWLDTEIELVHPRAIVCLGATAAQALLGRNSRSPRIAAHSSLLRWRRSCSPLSIHRPFCAHRMPTPATARRSCLRTTCARLPGR